MIRTAVWLAILVIAVIWITSNPAQAGNDIHTLWTSAITFLKHVA